MSLNILPQYQTPKPSRDRGEPVCDKSRLPAWAKNYRPYADCPLVCGKAKSFQGSGVANERVAWRCPDCGAEAEDVTADCCSRCGSCEPLVYR